MIPVAESLLADVLPPLPPPQAVNRSAANIVPANCNRVNLLVRTMIHLPSFVGRVPKPVLKVIHLVNSIPELRDFN